MYSTASSPSAAPFEARNFGRRGEPTGLPVECSQIRVSIRSVPMFRLAEPLAAVGLSSRLASLGYISTTMLDTRELR